MSRARESRKSASPRADRPPSIERVLSDPGAEPLVRRYGRDSVKLAARAAAKEGGGRVDAILARSAAALAREFSAEAPRVVNATGVLIHTNLGRSPLSARVRDAIAAAAEGYHAVELDLGSGKRGSRGTKARALAARLVSAEDAIVVNNNAAAVLLALAAVAGKGEVLVSRGELVAIGGSFKIPEILEASGARLREVGTTNRTKIADFERARTKETAAVLTVHPSNYEIRGFAERPVFSEIARFCRSRRLPWIHDHGSGTIADLAPFGITGVERAADALRAGADLVAFSGDKLLGGTQAGILAGRRKLVEKCRRHPLARALRPDKIVLAGVFETLATWLTEGPAALPVYALAGVPAASLHARAERLAAGAPPALAAKAVATRALFGGGTTPEKSMPSAGIAIPGKDRPAEDLARALRGMNPPIVGRVQGGRLVLDLRTVFPEEDAAIASAMVALSAPAPDDLPPRAREV
jgi:L-seryl-tRNA(Ser) seleniumtransferase